MTLSELTQELGRPDEFGPTSVQFRRLVAPHVSCKRHHKRHLVDFTGLLAKQVLSQLSYTPTARTSIDFRAFATVRKLRICLCAGIFTCFHTQGVRLRTYATMNETQKIGSTKDGALYAHVDLRRAMGAFTATRRPGGLIGRDGDPAGDFAAAHLVEDFVYLRERARGYFAAHFALRG